MRVWKKNSATALEILMTQNSTCKIASYSKKQKPVIMMIIPMDLLLCHRETKKEDIQTRLEKAKVLMRMGIQFLRAYCLLWMFIKIFIMFVMGKHLVDVRYEKGKIKF